MQAEPDHLIERAAARLQMANGLVALEQPRPERVANLGATTGPAPDRLAMPPSEIAPAAPGREPAAHSAAPRITLAQLVAAGMAITGSDRTRISEEYRIVTDRLHRAASATSQPVRNLLMVTSARPGEGKSFTALNLAATVARSGGRALLADFDAGTRSLSLALGLIDSPGLRDLARDPALHPQSLIVETELPGLTLLPRGHSHAGRGLLADAPAMTAVLERLARRFPNHTIILDTSPTLAISDPHALAPHVGQIALVIEAERTQRAEVEAALDLLRVCPTITAVLNKARFSGRNTFGSYDAGYYTNAS